MKLNKTLLAHLAILTTNILFGLNFVFVKNLLPKYMSGITLAFIRLLSGTLLIGGLALLIKHRKIEKKDIFKLILAGSLGLGLTQTLFMEGLSRTSSVDAAIITTFVPILVMVFSALLYSEKITRNKVLGIILGTLGTLLIVLKGGHEGVHTTNMLKGNLLMTCCTISYSFYYIWLTPLMKKYNPMMILGLVFAIGAIFMTPYSIKGLINTDFSSLNSLAIISLLFIILGSTFVGYSAMAYSFTRLSPTTSSIYSYGKPIVTMIAAAFIGQDRITLTRIIAIALVIGGVIVISRNKKQKLSKFKESLSEKLDNLAKSPR